MKSNGVHLYIAWGKRGSWQEGEDGGQIGRSWAMWLEVQWTSLSKSYHFFWLSIIPTTSCMPVLKIVTVISNTIMVMVTIYILQKGTPLRMKEGSINVYTKTTGVKQNCPGQTKTNGYPIVILQYGHIHVTEVFNNRYVRHTCHMLGAQWSWIWGVIGFKNWQVRQKLNLIKIILKYFLGL